MAFSQFLVVISCLLLLGTTFASAACHRPTEDTIDLGYAKHKSTWVNKTSAGTELLNYNNIRYAKPPIGSRRFRKPEYPPFFQDGVQDGNISSWKTDCLSSAPRGVPFPLINGSTWGSEDCLFLNVVKPKNAKPGDSLPVLHWVVGSAYVFGGKDWTGFGINTYGLFNRPLNLTDNFIIVTHNYRLGIPGWTPKLADDMDGNLGVWDILAAVEWTKKYIYKFGGDPSRITVIGQSAGAGIITWLLLGKEGKMKLPSDSAWIASPSIAPRRNLERSAPVFDQILNATKCADIECMRHISEDDMKAANHYLMIELPSGPGGGSLGPGVGFTPTVDGQLLSDLPANLFSAGKFNKGIKNLVVGNTALEGLGLSSDRDMPNRFPEIVRANIPNASDEAIQTLLSMYPFPKEIPETLAWEFITDIIWSCTTGNIAEAYGKIARRFLFSIPPATHGLDLSYFFYADNISTPVLSTDVAYAAESILPQFISRQDFPRIPEAPHVRSLSEWPYYAVEDTMANITLSGFEFERFPDHIARRCAFINSLITDPANGV